MNEEWLRGKNICPGDGELPKGGIFSVVYLPTTIVLLYMRLLTSVCRYSEKINWFATIRDFMYLARIVVVGGGKETKNENNFLRRGAA